MKRAICVRHTSWFRQGDPIFVSREVSQDLEVIGSPKFQRLRNRSPSGCRKTVQSKTTKNAEDIRCRKTEKMDRFSSDLYLFRDLKFFFERFWTGQLLLCRFQKVMGLWWSNLLQSAEMHFSASTREHLSEMPATNHNVAFWHTRNFIGSRIFFKKKHWFVGKNAWALACWHGLLSGFVRAVFCYFFVRFFCFSFFLHNKL